MNSSTRFRGIFQTGEYADLFLRCPDKTFKAHRAIICSASPRLAELAKSQAQLHDGLLAIDLPEDSDVIEHLLAFVYLGDYNSETVSASAKECFEMDGGSRNDSEWTAETPGESSAAMESEETPGKSNNTSNTLLLHAKMFFIARTYNIPALQEIALSRFEEHGLRKKDVPAFTEAMKMVYDEIEDPNNRMKGVLHVMAKQRKELVLQHRSFISLLDSNCVIACDLLLSVLKLNRPGDIDEESEKQELDVEVEQAEERSETAHASATVYDEEEFDKYGFDKEGFDQRGLDIRGCDRDGVLNTELTERDLTRLRKLRARIKKERLRR